MPNIVRKKISYVGNVHDIQPIGEICNIDVDSAPPGYLPCDGRSVLRSKYPELFKKIGTKYGAVDDEHFNLPNEDDADKNDVIYIENDEEENFNDDTVIHVDGNNTRNPNKIITKKIIKLLDWIKSKLINDDTVGNDLLWSSQKTQSELNNTLTDYYDKQSVDNKIDNLNEKIEFKIIELNLPNDTSTDHFYLFDKNKYSQCNVISVLKLAISNNTYYQEPTINNNYEIYGFINSNQVSFRYFNKTNVWYGAKIFVCVALKKR